MIPFRHLCLRIVPAQSKAAYAGAAHPVVFVCGRLSAQAGLRPLPLFGAALEASEDPVARFFLGDAFYLCTLRLVQGMALRFRLRLIIGVVDARPAPVAQGAGARQEFAPASRTVGNFRGAGLRGRHGSSATGLRGRRGRESVRETVGQASYGLPALCLHFGEYVFRGDIQAKLLYGLPNGNGRFLLPDLPGLTRFNAGDCLGQLFRRHAGACRRVYLLWLRLSFGCHVFLSFSKRGFGGCKMLVSLGRILRETLLMLWRLMPVQPAAMRAVMNLLSFMSEQATQFGSKLFRGASDGAQYGFCHHKLVPLSLIGKYGIPCGGIDVGVLLPLRSD